MKKLTTPIDEAAVRSLRAGDQVLLSGVEHSEGNEQRLTPIKKGDLKFETLADCIVESKPDMTIISSSPLLEHDAMYMRIIHERCLSRKVAKALRLKKKEAEAAGESA